MTSPLPKSRRTTTPAPSSPTEPARIGWIPASLLVACWLASGLPAMAQFDEGRAARSLPSLDITPNNESNIENALSTEAVAREHELVLQEVRNANARLRETPESASDLINVQNQDLLYKIDTDPPSRDRLFRALSGQQYLETLEEEYRKAGQVGAFYLPAPIDNFNGSDSGVLSAVWRQNWATGPEDPIEQRRGTLGIKGGSAEQPVHAEPEAAILNESVGSPDMQLTLQIELGGAGSTFGLVVRAGDPTRWVEPVDQIEANSYYYALFGEASVAIYRHVPNQEDVMLKSADIPAKRTFEAMVTVAGDTFRVYRDGEEVLSAIDTTEPGDEGRDYCGMIAGITEGAPTRVDNFWGRRYGGEYAGRYFAPSTAVFRGANVHYQPLYFEQITLERYGHHFGNLFAPWVAHALFFADAAMLPYSLGKSPPWQCHSDICLYKPGDIVPFRIHLPAKDCKGAILQATAVAIAWAAIP